MDRSQDLPLSITSLLKIPSLGGVARSAAVGKGATQNALKSSLVQGSCEKLRKQMVWEGERPREPFCVRVFLTTRLAGTLALPIFSQLQGDGVFRF